MDYSVEELLKKGEEIKDLPIYERNGLKMYKFKLIISNLDVLMQVDHDNGRTLSYSLPYYLRWNTIVRPINIAV